MSHSHSYLPIAFTTLTLPTLDHVYETFVVFQCPCGSTDSHTYAIGNRHPLPTWAELRRLERWGPRHVVEPLPSKG